MLSKAACCIQRLQRQSQPGEAFKVFQKQLPSRAPAEQAAGMAGIVQIQLTDKASLPMLVPSRSDGIKSKARSKSMRG